MNSVWSTVPDPSLSILFISSSISHFFKWSPSAFNASPSSWTSMVPELSLSKSKNALLISSLYSPVSFLEILDVFRNTRFHLYIFPPLSSLAFGTSTYLNIPVNIISSALTSSYILLYLSYLIQGSFSRPFTLISGCTDSIFIIYSSDSFSDWLNIRDIWNCVVLQLQNGRAVDGR